jgi:hypothetical protein
VAGLFILYLPKGWSWLAILLYVPLALWLICSVTVQTVKRDWLYSSLMLLPVPTIIGWLLAVEPAGSFPNYNVQRVDDLVPWIGMSFLAFALAVAVFIRLRQRWLKVAVLFISGFLTLVMVAYYAEGRLSLGTFSILTLMVLGLFLAPALLERRIRYRRQPLA